MEIHNSFRVAGIRLWSNGQPLPENKRREIPSPLEVTYDSFRGYEGPPREYTDTGIPIMSERLHDILQSLGVDNIDYFPATLKNNSTGNIYPYFAYKIIGLVSLSGLKKSVFEACKNNKLAIEASDTDKSCRQYLFRLAESTSTIIVHEKIKLGIERAGIDTIKFTSLMD